MNLIAQLPSPKLFLIPSIVLGSSALKTFQVSLCRIRKTFLEIVLNCFQLTTLVIMISLADVPHLEILSQNAMTCAKLKQLTKGMTMYATNERFQLIGVLPYIQLHLGGRVVLAEFI